MGAGAKGVSFARSHWVTREPMADILTARERSQMMSRIRGRDTKPELLVRAALHALGYRFRTHVRELPGTPDLVFSKRRMAVFVHGCFWHRHGCSRTYMPKSRQEFWQAKFSENIERDLRVQKQLLHGGWGVFIAWECEIETDDTVITRLAAFLGPPRMPERPRPWGRSGRRQGSSLSSSTNLVK